VIVEDILESSKMLQHHHGFVKLLIYPDKPKLLDVMLEQGKKEAKKKRRKEKERERDKERQRSTHTLHILHCLMKFLLCRDTMLAREKLNMIIICINTQSHPFLKWIINYQLLFLVYVF
jgi:hypothetical protein